MATKAKKIEEKTVEIEVTFPLSSAEKVKRADLALACRTELKSVEAEKKIVLDRFKAKIITLKAEAEKYDSEYETATETKLISAIERKNHSTHRVEFVYKGKVVKTREMTFADCQEDLPLKPAKVLKKREVGSDGVDLETKRGKKQPTNPFTPGTHEHEAHEDLKKSIKQQTSKKTAHSSVDGPSGNAVSAVQ